jgi:hypothetical protein
MSANIDITVTKITDEPWLYNAFLYGKDTADLIANVETSVELLPEVGEGRNQ